MVTLTGRSLIGILPSEEDEPREDQLYPSPESQYCFLFNLWETPISFSFITVLVSHSGLYLASRLLFACCIHV